MDLRNENGNDVKQFRSVLFVFVVNMFSLDNTDVQVDLN